MTECEFAQEVLACMGELVCVRDCDMNILYINPAAERFTGVSLQDAVQKKCHDLFGDENQACGQACSGEEVINRYQGLACRQRKIKNQDRDLRTMQVSISPLRQEGRTVGTILVMKDITDLKQLEETHIQTVRKLEKEIAARATSEFYLKEAQAVAQIGSWHLDVQKEILTWTEETYRVFDMEPGTPMTLDRFLDRVHPDDRSRVKDAWQKALDGKPYNIEHRIIAGKTERWVHEKARIRFDARHHPVEAVGTVQHITSRKEAENRLKIMGAAIEQNPATIVITDPNADIEYVNPTFYDLTGYHKTEVIGKNPRILQSGNTSRETYARLWETLKAGQNWRGELQNKKKNGELYWEEVLISPIFDDHRNISHYIGIKTDITQKKKAEALLRIERDLGTRLGLCVNLKQAFDICLDAVLKVGRFDCGGIYLFDPLKTELNLVVHQHLAPDFVKTAEKYGPGSPQLELIAQGRPVYQAYEELASLMGLSPGEKKIRDGLRSIAVVPIMHGKTLLGAVNVASRSQEKILETDQVALEGIVSRVAGRLAQIKTEQEKRISENRLWAAIEAIDEGFVLYDADDRLVTCNAKYLEIYQKSKEAIIPGARFEDILKHGLGHDQYPEAKGREQEWLEKRMKLHHSLHRTAEQALPGNRWVKISEKKTSDGSTVGFRVDITGMKRYEEKLKKALKEKEDLLKEIHHRVKNNMQVVSSLLSLQADQSDDPKVMAAFQDTELRVRSMAIVHEILYQAEQLSEIDFQTYIETLTGHLAHAFISGTPARIQIDAEKISLKLDHAIPCGLVIAELATNALKYAAPPESGLVIRVAAVYDNRDNICLTIRDNGAKLNQKFDPAQPQTLGLRLVTEIITDQLEGTYQVDQDQGVCWRIQWPSGPMPR